MTTQVCFPSVLQVIAATNRVDTLDPALLRSGEEWYQCYDCHVRKALTQIYICTCWSLLGMLITTRNADHACGFPAGLLE